MVDDDNQQLSESILQRGTVPMRWIASLTILAGALGVLIGAFAFGSDTFPDDTSPDAGFLRDMSVHHAQAVRMAGHAYRTTENEQIRVLAYDILTTQQGQIGIMTGWLDAWGLSTTGLDAPMAWMGHEMDGPMPGMASEAELTALEQMTGPAMDREFLRLMILHHVGGASMATAGVELGTTVQVRDLATAIIETQDAETTYMRDLLANLPE
jgi:uncharacterized protein (DUF305 family)